MSNREMRELNIVGQGPFLDAPHPEVLTTILDTASCILWTSDVEGRGDWQSDNDPMFSRLIWKPRVLNEAGAQRVLPLEIKPGSNYFEAWRDSRHRSDDRRMWETALHAFVTAAPSYHQIFRCFDRNGVEHWIREEVAVTGQGLGRWYCVGLATDITPDWQQTLDVQRISQRLEQAIQEQKDSDVVLDLVLDCVPVGVALLSRDGRFVRVNREFCRLNGTSEPTLAGEPVTRWVDPALAQALDADLQSLLASAAPTPTRELLLEGSFGPRTCELRLYPVQLHGSEAIAAGVLLVDVTESRQMQQSRMAREVAEAASAAKDRFLAMLSHELRMPLTPVLALSSTLEQDTRLPEECRQDLTTIRRNTQLEARLIDDLLDLTRITRGKLSLARQHCDLHEIIRRSVAAYRPQLLAKDLACELQLQATRTTVDADPVRIQQVITNLLSNAQKFTPSGGHVVLRTRDTSLSAQPGIQLEVEDDGMGITSESLVRVFDPFEQGLELHDHQRQAGLGLGLAISRHLAEAHGGTISARSPGRGQGSVFTVLLPSLPGTVATAPPAPVPTAAQTAAAVLLVEDHADTARVLQRLLQRLHYRVTVAGSVQEALALLKASQFDIIVSDLGLPDGSGREIAQQRPQNTPAIALSGFGSDEDIKQSKAAGFLDHLTKPVTVQQLQSAIQRCLLRDSTTR